MTTAQKQLKTTLNVLFALYTSFRAFVLFILTRLIGWDASEVLDIAYHDTDGIEVYFLIAFLMFLVGVIISIICFIRKKKIFGTLYFIMAAYSLFLYFICGHFDYLFVYGATPRWIVDIVNFVR